MKMNKELLVLSTLISSLGALQAYAAPSCSGNDIRSRLPAASWDANCFKDMPGLSSRICETNKGEKVSLTCSQSGTLIVSFLKGVAKSNSQAPSSKSNSK
jgi:hypothetical protein